MVKVVLRKTHLKMQKTPPAHQDSTSGERISREIFEISKKNFVCFEAVLTAYFIPWKNQF